MCPRVALSVLAALWGIGLVTLAIFAFAFPAWSTGSFYSTSLIDPPDSPNWLELFLPANPFWSMANNMIPAVVVFFAALGVALMRLPGKGPLLGHLDVVVAALGRLNRMMVRLAPIGVFGIVGHATGTLSYSEITLLQGYMLAFGAASILLCVWVVPALIASVTPFSQREILSALRDTLMTAFIIGNTFVVLPMIVEAVQQLFHRHGLNREDAAHLPEYSVQLAYPFPDIGRIVTLIFIPFAAWFYGMHIAPFAYPKLNSNCMTTGSWVAMTTSRHLGGVSCAMFCTGSIEPDRNRSRPSTVNEPASHGYRRSEAECRTVLSAR